MLSRWARREYVGFVLVPGPEPEPQRRPTSSAALLAFSLCGGIVVGMNRHTLLIRKLAEIDQLLAGAYELSDDFSLKMHDLFSVCDSIESLERSRRDVEAALSSQA